MKPRNISLYNSSFIDIYMAPSNDWHLIEPGLDKLNLTWRVTEFKEDYMIFKLKFENELAISSKPDFDEVVIHIQEVGDLFISETLL